MDSVFSSHYFGNIEYYSRVVAAEAVVIDVYENYSKQTYRNRCDLIAANGVLRMSVPTIKVHNQKILMKDIEIDYSTSWQKQHLKTVVSAYKNSPYFDYYFDIIEPIFTKKEQLLIDLNSQALEATMSIIGLKKEIILSNKYVDNEDIEDYRDIISPKNKIVNKDFNSIEYYQVFSEKMVFKPNMSILDLIFCEGLGSLDILERSIINVGSKK